MANLDLNLLMDMKTSVTFSFNEGKEKIEFPVFNLVSGYAESELEMLKPEFYS